jgi:signal transduction histidine kinase
MKSETTLFPENIIDIDELLEFSPNALLVSKKINGIHRPVYCNSLFKEDIGYTIEEIPDIASWFRVAYPDEEYRKVVIKAWEAEINKGRTFGEITVKIRCKDGIDKWFKVKVSLWKKDVEIVIFSNIDTLVRQNEELEKLNIMKDKIFSVISHDIRTPLSNLKGMLDLIEYSVLDEKEIKYLTEQVNYQLHNVSDLLENLLKWAKNQLKSSNPQPEPFNLIESIHKNINLLKPQAKKKNILMEEGPKGHLTVFADTEMINSVIRNLLNNAIKFTPYKGKVWVDTYTENKFVVVSVKDNGIGIDYDKKEKLLNCESITTIGTNNEKGIGLGLLICQEFVKLNGGKMWIDSEPNKGSIFRFSVPMVENI